MIYFTSSRRRYRVASGSRAVVDNVDPIADEELTKGKHLNMNAHLSLRSSRQASAVCGPLILSAVASLVGCQGVIGDAEQGGTPGAGRSAFRRLSPQEVEASLSTLASQLSVDGSLASPLIAAPDIRYQFSNTADTGNFSFDQVRNLMSWAEAVSSAATSDLTRSVGCIPSNAWDACVRDFVSRLGRLAFRRPLEASELETFRVVYEDVASQSGSVAAVRAMWELVLQSPQFWFLSNATRPGSRQLTSHAIAARLSYSLWGTMPDSTLSAAADRDELRSASQIRAQAERMLADPKAEAMVRRFHREWLHVDAATSLDKDTFVYPGFDGATAQDLDEEFDRYVQRLVFEGGTVEQLLAGQQGYVNQRLESLLGLEPVSSGVNDWVWRDLGPQRAGILSRPLYLANTAGRSESSLIERGVAVIENMLCTVLRAPPNATEEAVEIPPDASSGKLLGVQNRASKPACATCHDTIDPIGLAFEVFDAVGGYRTQYPDGVPIETTGVLSGRFVDEDLSYPDAAGLMAGLARMPKVQQCYASKWIEWATGRTPTEAQSLEVERIAQSGQTSIRALLLEVVTSRLLLQKEES